VASNCLRFGGSHEQYGHFRASGGERSGVFSKSLEVFQVASGYGKITIFNGKITMFNGKMTIIAGEITLWF